MQADNEFALLKHTVMQGWPCSIKQVPPVLQPYWTFREELTVEDGIILKGTRIVIPTKQWEAILKLIYKGHLGFSKCKLHAKETVYWSGLNDQVENLVLNCELCLKYSNSKCKQEASLLLGQEVPLYPWTKLATGMFHFLFYLLLTILAGFQLYTSLHWWRVNALQVTSNSYVLNMDGQKLWSQTMDHVKHLKCLPPWWEVQYQSYYNLTPLPTIQWVSWKICTTCKELVL